MNYSEIVDTLIDEQEFADRDKFSLLKAIADAETETNDLAVLVAMHLESKGWGPYTEIAASYVRSRGLFPYLSDDRAESISFRDRMARDFFESPSRDGVFMHRSQYAVLSRLLKGESVVLSAPTSFGKSFIIEELLRSGKYKNVVIIVPTIALIEEFREKIKKLHTNHNRVSFSQQNIGEENIFILTQERAFDMQSVISQLPVDLLVIDEFYKMDETLLAREDSDRANLLNVVYRNFSSIADQVYLLGPFIDGIEGLKTSRHNPTWIESTDNTTYIVRKKLTAASRDRIMVTCKTAVEAGEDVMVYCSSPATLRKLYVDCLAGYAGETDANDDLIEWINENIGREWYVTDALRHGVGVHHGKLPRFLAHEMIRRFSDGRIKILLCTSSLIEGVNTNAKTIIIHNSQQRFNGDLLTFRNISGRAGRMFRHFWGTVYYYEEPKDNEIIVNDAIGTDGSETAANILSLVDDAQLTDQQSKSVEKHRTGTYIPWEILQQNKFIDVELQEEVVNQIRSSTQDADTLKSIKTPQLSSFQMQVVFKYASMLGLNTFKYAHARENVLSKSLIRLSIFIDYYLRDGFRGLASQMGGEAAGINDSSIESAFYFLKNGMSYDFPKYLRAFNRLQSFALGDDAGDVEPFANRLEYLDTYPAYVQLDELGLPIELSQKLRLNPNSTDLAVNSLSSAISSMQGFERRIAEDFLSRY